MMVSDHQKMLLVIAVAFSVVEAITGSIQESDQPILQTSAFDGTNGANASSETPSLSSNVSALDAKMFVECDGSTYGFNLNLAACQEMKSFIAFESKQRNWGERHTPTFKKLLMFPLPYMLMDGKLPNVRVL